MSKILFLTDLDHNLFQSLRVDCDGIHPMTVNKEGKNHCYATTAQKTLFELFAKNAFCVSVTARSPDQMMRVTGWETMQSNDLALTDLGMTLLHRKDKGEWSSVPEWSAEYIGIAKGKSTGVEVDFAQLRDSLVDRFGTAFGTDNPNIKLTLNMCHESPETPYYFIVTLKCVDDECPTTEDMRHACERFLDECQGDYFYHESENTFAFWPTYVTKESAVQRLIECFGVDIGSKVFSDACDEKGVIDLIISSGDSISDLGFMNAAHFWMAPSVSQISSTIGVGGILTPSNYKG